MSMHRTLIAAAVFALSSPVFAQSVDFTGFAHGSETVHFAVSAPNTVASGDVYAGGFATTLNGGPSFTSYCIDLYQHINFADPAYTDYTRNDGHVFTNPSAYANLGRLFGSYFSQVDTAKEEAAFQIAVWEIAYENSSSPYSLAGGAAIFSGGTAASSGALTLAQQWLDNLGTQALAPRIYESTGHQDVVAAPVPEPSTIALMVAGIAGMGALSRRRRLAAERG